MARTKRPVQVYSFADFSRRTPNVPPPGDRIDAQFRQHADAIAEIQQIVDRLRPEPAPVDVKALAAEIKTFAALELEALKAKVENADAIIDQARFAVARAWADADRAKQTADGAEARIAAAIEQVRQDLTPVPLEPTLPNAALGPNAGGFYAGDDKGATATSADYADVAINWAEFMPSGAGTDTIPPNILAINGISGDHWSSRWWANRAASAFGMLAWWYMGAWPGPPPSTPNTPTGQPIPPGAMYFDTVLGVMLVWNGSTWAPLAQGPAKATTSSLYYLSAAGQTVFPLSTADLAGHTFAFNQTVTEGLQAYVNGVRVTPVADYAVDTVASTVTFVHPVTLSAVVAFDLLVNPSLLAPTGSAATLLLSPISPDGVKTAFTGLTVAAGGAVNVAHNEELLVSVNGIQQSPGAAYNASGAAITFTQAPEADALVFMVWFGPAATRAAAPTPPVNTAAPVVSGTPAVGSTLSCSTGSWA